MPFAKEFDDVYDAIRKAVEDAVEQPGSCARLDENRPAGRITERLIRELRLATFCVADITDEKPNVMWELGYAMALGKPTIVITQDLSKLPFDIADIQSIKYDRRHLRSTLTRPLKSVAVDTLASLRVRQPEVTAVEAPKDAELAILRKELTDVKSMILEVVRLSKPIDATASPQISELQKITGAWVNEESNSHAYAALVNGDLVVPYSYQSNDFLTGVYFGWRRIGEYWFARYQWLGGDPSGFTFLKQDALDLLTGAWWSSSDEDTPTAPPKTRGVPATWRRAQLPTPSWANAFITEVTRKGLAAVLDRFVER